MSKYGLTVTRETDHACSGTLAWTAEAATLPATAIGALAGTVVVKGIIWIGCIRIKTTQVQALAQGMLQTHEFSGTPVDALIHRL